MVGNSTHIYISASKSLCKVGENIALGTDLSFSSFFCRFAIRKLASSHAKILMVATFGFLPPDQNPIEDFVELVIWWVQKLRLRLMNIAFRANWIAETMMTTMTMTMEVEVLLTTGAKLSAVAPSVQIAFSLLTIRWDWFLAVKIVIQLFFSNFGLHSLRGYLRPSFDDVTYTFSKLF